MEHAAVTGVCGPLSQYIDCRVVVTTWLMMVVVLGFAYFLGKNLRKFPNGVQYTFEALTSFIVYTLEDAMGKYGRKFFPLIAGLATFILFANLVGLIPLPWIKQPTSSLNTTLALAIISFLVYNYEGVKKHGLINYIKHFAGPVPWMAPIMFPIEVVSHLSRILSLSFRLFGNMFGDEMVVLVALMLVPFLVPVAGEFIVFANSFLQTFIFCILTVVYIATAIEEHEEEHVGY
ncbi:ATP synthase F0, A subunit [Thermovibrio ammonificans HB-1]|jgi:F-type H+-transporting ATPase subunit a|uniref:ATP synthase subunit a n=1 Tax=Thermovibrio ammonificans (strain DSM 15698 / JCM 12110 / HB-1) TaxID=648996 RepID=E8T530_THEA1|nr:F0F1 ATP synthase subunit A [Thermovibrio ammonificans]ADU97562.1 ATP synthase F0, A subunit [Thermovibrio ammonificans HB-1]